MAEETPKQPEQEAAVGNRPSETLDLNNGVRSGRWKQERDNGSYFLKAHYNTFYNRAEEGEPADFENTYWFGAHQATEKLKGIQTWNQRDGVSKEELASFNVPAGMRVEGHPNMTIFSIGEVSVKVLDQISPNNKPYRVFLSSTNYKTDDGEWHEGHSFTRSQNIKLEVCMTAAIDYLGTPMKTVDQLQSQVGGITDLADEDIPF